MDTQTRYQQFQECSREGLFMNERDLGELYTYVELFHKTYRVCEQETEAFMKAIRKLYYIQTGIPEEEVIRPLQNPRDAGRKRQLTDDDYAVIRELRKKGYTIREIAQETSISKSSVQRVLNPMLSQY